ncbi:uncharacterized protein IAS62_000383 [Cryptococcus decagattii]|uniref:Glycosyl transferase CAP10 domain-containing protein n=1 Tax=Cryptococcus decagattii TaxID=1859122 RepID=A0ABZ2AKN7_9TREE
MAPSRAYTPPVSPKPKNTNLSHSILPHGAPPVSRPIRRPKKIIYLAVIFFLLYWFGIRHGLGRERLPIPPLGYAVNGGRRGRKSSLAWHRKGMATLLHPQPGIKQEHPIYELMERAETRWTTMLASQSTTLPQAAAQYRKRYGIDPPLGFDVWFDFCKRHGIKIIDEYDQMMRDILPHHALPPAMFMARSKALEGAAYTYTLDISQEHVSVTGERSTYSRPQHLQRLIAGFKGDLPPEFHLRVTGSDHDTGSVVLGRDQRMRAMELVQQGKHFDEDELKSLENPNRTPAWGWFKACPLDSPANIRPWSENATDEFQLLSKFPFDSSFQTTPMEGYMNITEDVPFLAKWEDKIDNRLFWRGSTTGGYTAQRDWRDSHRLRLHLMINGPKGGDAWWDQQLRDVMVPDGEGGFKIVRRWERVLSKAYADVKLSGQPVQCPSEEICKEVANTIEFGNKVWPDEAAVYKYNLDVDGNGWSSRFHRLLSSGSPVIKFTMFPEWHQEWLTPWYHYIPLKPDYSDLYDIMAFFVGPLDDAGHIDYSKGHDYLAQKIGNAGQKFALEHWSWVDMQAYMFRMLLELQRLHSLDRSSMSYKGPVGKG